MKLLGFVIYKTLHYTDRNLLDCVNTMNVNAFTPLCGGNSQGLCCGLQVVMLHLVDKSLTSIIVLSVTKYVLSWTSQLRAKYVEGYCGVLIHCFVPNVDVLVALYCM